MDQLILQILNEWAPSDPLLAAHLRAATFAAQAQVLQVNNNSLTTRVAELESGNVSPLKTDQIGGRHSDDSDDSDV